MSNKKVEDSGSLIYVFILSAARQPRLTPEKLHMDLPKLLRSAEFSCLSSWNMQHLLLFQIKRIMMPPCITAVLFEFQEKRAFDLWTFAG